MPKGKKRGGKKKKGGKEGARGIIVACDDQSPWSAGLVPLPTTDNESRISEKKGGDSLLNKTDSLSALRTFFFFFQTYA